MVNSKLLFLNQKLQHKHIFSANKTGYCLSYIFIIHVFFSIYTASLKQTTSLFWLGYFLCNFFIFFSIIGRFSQIFLVFFFWNKLRIKWSLFVSLFVSPNYMGNLVWMYVITYDSICIYLPYHTTTIDLSKHANCGHTMNKKISRRSFAPR